MRTAAMAVIVAVGLAAQLATASVPKTKSLYPKEVSLQRTEMALALPYANRVETLKAQGPEGYKNLVAIVKSERESLETRWRAVTALGRIGGLHALPELEMCLKSRHWFLRSAALISLSQVDRDEGLFWARKLLSDKALLVRSAAVDVIQDANDKGSRQVLWSKLAAPENFKGGQSLFIRRRIVETLAQMEDREQAAQFVQLLSDRDESLHLPAVQALEKITNQKFGKVGESVETKRVYWQQWWKEQQKKTL